MLRRILENKYTYTFIEFDLFLKSSLYDFFQVLSINHEVQLVIS